MSKLMSLIYIHMHKLFAPRENELNQIDIGKETA